MIFSRELWIEIGHTVIANPLRTALTGLSVGLGIFILVVMQGLGFGLQNGVQQDFGDEASNSLWIRTNRTTLPFRGRQANRSIELRNADKEILTEKLFETPLHSARRMLWGSTIQAGNEEGRFAVVGVNEDYDQLESIPLVSGRWLHQEDLAQSAKVCVIGQTIVDDLFKKKNPIGEYIRLRNVTFRVIGTFSRSGSRWTNSMALIPITTLQRVFEGADQVGRVIVSTGDRTVEEASAMASMADGALRTRHAVHPDDQRAVRVEDNNEEFAMYQRIFMGIRLFIWVIGGFTLFAGAIGVANIMSIVVKERTVEIGVRKALGATSGSIVTLIVVEAIALTSISGILGMIAGVLTLEFVAPFAEHDYFSNPAVNLNVTITALGVLVLSGAMSGLAPALRAVRIRPIEALRYE
jgi:putative ABC transport system permease protein